MEFFRIVNWSRYQHYKNRRPPWIKLYNKLLRKHEFLCLQDDSKLLLILLWVLASTFETENGDEPKIPNDPNYLKSVLPVNTKPNLQPLIDKGFIEMIASCKQDASNLPQKTSPKIHNTETDNTETEKKKRFFSVNIPPTHDCPDFRETWHEWEQHRVEIKKKLTPSTARRQLNMLSEHPVYHSIKIIENSIVNGWVGLFPDQKGKGKQKTELSTKELFESIERGGIK